MTCALQAVQSALVELCAGLNEAAVVSEGEVERLVEKEAMALNTSILGNRWGVVSTAMVECGGGGVPWSRRS
jgi:hypothetical protein